MARRINVVRAMFVVVLVSLVLGVNQGFSADWSSVFKDVKAKYAKFEKEIKDITIVQEVKITTPKGKTTSDMKMLRKDKKFRMEIKMQMPQTPDMPKGMGEMEAVIIYDGEDMWMISSFLGRKKLSDEEEKQYQTEKNWWDLISEKAKIVGTEKEFPFTKIWLDKKSLNLIQGERKQPKEETVLWVHSDFKKIKGDWEMPYKAEMYTGGELMTTSIVKLIEVNKGLSDDLFDPEKVKVKEIDMQEMMKKMMEEEEKGED